MVNTVNREMANGGDRNRSRSRTHSRHDVAPGGTARQTQAVLYYLPSYHPAPSVSFIPLQGNAYLTYLCAESREIRDFLPYRLLIFRSIIVRELIFFLSLCFLRIARLLSLSSTGLSSRALFFFPTIGIILLSYIFTREERNIVK